MRRLAITLAVVACAARERPVAPPSASQVLTGVRTSVIDTMVLRSISGEYRWSTAQRDSAMAVLATNRAKWVTFRPRTIRVRGARLVLLLLDVGGPTPAGDPG
jgi:hypothetical protein